MKVLFVHGLNSDCNSTTGQYVKKFFKDAEFICPTFDLFDVKGTLNKILSYDFDIIVGHSLGGFYVLNTFKDSSIKRIVINPCFYPTAQIPKLKEHVPEETIKLWKELEQYTYDQEPEDKENIFGIFAKDDELFSYYDEFKSIYSSNNCCYIEGDHRPNANQIADGLTQAIEWKALGGSYDAMSFDTSDFDELFEKMKQKDYEKKLEEQTRKLTENFKNIFTKKKDIKSEAYLDQYGEKCYKILQDGYQKLGGIKGIYSLQNLIDESDFWKVYTKNGEPLAVVVYTFKRGGRKVMCCSCVPTEAGKMGLYQIVKDDIKFKEREAWLEASDAMEHIYAKFGAAPIPIDIIRKIMYDKTLYDDLNDPALEGKHVIRTRKEPGLEKYHYVRELGKVEGTDEPEYHEKIAFGNYPEEKLNH